MISKFSEEFYGILKPFYFQLRKLVRSEMLGIVEEVPGGDWKEMETMLSSRLSLTNFDCYERVARHFSKVCYSIAKVTN
jgi:hypothetical protein